MFGIIIVAVVCIIAGAEMKSFAKGSRSKYEVESDAASDQRSRSPLLDYGVIEKSGEQPNGRVQRQPDDDSHRISPISSSMSTSSEAESTASYVASAMVRMHALLAILLTIVINYSIFTK